jgi:cell division protein FtsB
MNEPQKQPLDATVEYLAAEVARLRERVEDLEDARELDEAIRRNAENPLIPWDQAKKDLGLD